MLPTLAEAFQYLADMGLVSFREALDELIWGESGILVLTTVREGDGACVVSFDHSEEEACIGQREWLRHDRGNSAGFFDAEEWTTMPRTEYPGKIRCVAVNRHVEAIEGEEEEKVQRYALGLRISGLPAPADVGAYVRGACQIPCGGSNAALRSLYANRLPCLAAWLPRCCYITERRAVISCHATFKHTLTAIGKRVRPKPRQNPRPALLNN